MTYKINSDIIKSIKGKQFVYPDEEWSKIIFNNRIGNDNLTDYDYVYGHVADGLMAPLIENITKGTKTFEDFKRDIIPDCKLFYYDQFVFKTGKSLEMINLINEEVL